jgi:hypothetical protein
LIKEIFPEIYKSIQNKITGLILDRKPVIRPELARKEMLILYANKISSSGLQPRQPFQIFVHPRTIFFNIQYEGGIEMPTIVHFDIPADDPERAKSFYSRLFGWKFEKPIEDMEYYLVDTKNLEADIPQMSTKIKLFLLHILLFNNN